jgi:hypothetical protein
MLAIIELIFVVLSGKIRVVMFAGVCGYKKCAAGREPGGDQSRRGELSY